MTTDQVYEVCCLISFSFIFKRQEQDKNFLYMFTFKQVNQYTPFSIECLYQKVQDFF